MVLTLHFVGSALQGQLEELLCNPQTFPSGSWDVISVISTFWGSWGRGLLSAVSHKECFMLAFHGPCIAREA